MLTLLLALLLIVVLLACLALTLFGLPGNWLIVAVTAIYACLKPAGSAAGIGWRPIVILVVIAAMGEAVELSAATVGRPRRAAADAGPPWRWFARLSGRLSACSSAYRCRWSGRFWGAPFRGPWGRRERCSGNSGPERTRSAVGGSARRRFSGRLAGTLAKICLGGLMVTVVIVALVW